MKFETLKDFWEWLTISTGDVVTDFKAIRAYMDSDDINLIKCHQVDLVTFYRSILLRLANEQQELELK
jgi:hypothetical protein